MTNSWRSIGWFDLHIWLQTSKRFFCKKKSWSINRLLSKLLNERHFFLTGSINFTWIQKMKILSKKFENWTTLLNQVSLKPIFACAKLMRNFYLFVTSLDIRHLTLHDRKSAAHLLLRHPVVQWCQTFPNNIVEFQWAFLTEASASGFPLQNAKTQWLEGVYYLTLIFRPVQNLKHVHFFHDFMLGRRLQANHTYL